jgi:hypothetical protein
MAKKKKDTGVIRDDGSVNILIRANSNDENYQPCNMAYLELDKEKIIKWKELKDQVELLEKSHGVYSLTTGDSPFWIEELPDELTELYDALGDAEYFGVSNDECRTEGEEAVITKYGVSFKTGIKHCSIVTETMTLSWEFLDTCLKNCDPQSVRFIRDEDA